MTPYAILEDSFLLPGEWDIPSRDRRARCSFPIPWYSTAALADGEELSRARGEEVSVFRWRAEAHGCVICPTEADAYVYWLMTHDALSDRDGITPEGESRFCFEMTTEAHMGIPSPAIRSMREFDRELRGGAEAWRNAPFPSARIEPRPVWVGISGPQLNLTEEQRRFIQDGMTMALLNTSPRSTNYESSWVPVQQPNDDTLRAIRDLNQSLNRGGPRVTQWTEDDAQFMPEPGDSFLAESARMGAFGAALAVATKPLTAGQIIKASDITEDRLGIPNPKKEDK